MPLPADRRRGRRAHPERAGGLALHPKAERIQDELDALGLEADVVELPDSTRTAPEAAAAVGCELGAIVKSLVFRGAQSGEPILALVSGDRRCDESLLAAVAGETVERPDAEWVREVTGHAIGGIPPVGNRTPMRCFVENGLLRFEEVWAAAGTPRAVFGAEPNALAQAALGVIVPLATA